MSVFYFPRLTRVTFALCRSLCTSNSLFPMNTGHNMKSDSSICLLLNPRFDAPKHVGKRSNHKTIDASFDLNLKH